MNLNSIDEQLTNLGLIRPTANKKAREHLDRIFNQINDLDVQFTLNQYKWINPQNIFFE